LYIDIYIIKKKKKKKEGVRREKIKKDNTNKLMNLYTKYV
jgi:hypothetical protein